MTPINNTIVDVKHGDVTGDGSIDTVYLTADKTPDNPFWQNITLVVRNGRTNQYQMIPLIEHNGYDPTIFLGDFTGDKVDDILIIINTGGSGGIIYAYIFSFFNGNIHLIFDSNAFYNKYKYDVNYKNQYKADVIIFGEDLNFASN